MATVTVAPASSSAPTLKSLPNADVTKPLGSAVAHVFRCGQPSGPTTTSSVDLPIVCSLWASCGSHRIDRGLATLPAEAAALSGLLAWLSDERVVPVADGARTPGDRCVVHAASSMSAAITSPDDRVVRIGAP
jgi:hypothetical protein